METNSNEYQYIHLWLKKTYGKANHCDFCTNPKGGFQWALKKGMDHARNSDHYHQLCQSCHKKYDITQEARENMAKAKMGNKNLLGFKFSDKSRDKMRNSRLNKKDTEQTRQNKSIAGKKKIITALHKQHIKESWIIRKQKKQQKCA